MDSRYRITLLDREQRSRFFPNAEVSKLPASIRIRGLGSATHTTNKYVTLTTYVDSKLPNSIPATAKITVEAYLVDDLKANILIGNDVLIS